MYIPLVVIDSGNSLFFFVEQVVLPVTIEELTAPDAPFIKKTVKVRINAYG